jgi:hypothetical protein
MDEVVLGDAVPLADHAAFPDEPTDETPEVLELLGRGRPMHPADGKQHKWRRLTRTVPVTKAMSLTTSL